MADPVLRDPLLVRVEGYWGDEIRITDGGVYLFDVSSQQEIYIGREVTIDYETPDNLRDEERIGWQAAMERVDAALGDV